MPASIHELQVWKYPPTVGYASWTVVSALVCAARGDSIAAGAYRPRLPDGLTGWVAGRVAFSLFSACTISWMKNRPQCTILAPNCTLGRFFVREIVHIEAFMSMDDAMRARGHRPRSDSDVTDKGLRSALPSTPLAGAETDAIGSCAPRTAFPCPSVPPRAAAWSHLGVLSTRGYEESWGQMIRIRSKFAGLESPRDKHIAWRAKIGSYCLGAWRNWQTQGT